MEDLKKEVLDFLQKHYLFTLATVGEKYQPHAAVLYYFIDNDFNFYFITRKGSEKFRNLTNNSKVAFVVFEEELRQSVQAQGIGEIAEISGESENKIIQKLLENGHKKNMDSFVPLMSLYTESSIVLFRVKIKSIKWLKVDKGDQMILQELKF